MRVVITGITGFVGSHLVDYVLANHPESTIYGLVRWRSPMDNLEHIPSDKLNLYYGDLTDLSSLIRILKETRPDVIFHLAAQSAGEPAYDNPKKDYLSNGYGTYLISKLAKEVKAKKVIYTSSCSVYGSTLKKKN